MLGGISLPARCISYVLNKLLGQGMEGPRSSGALRRQLQPLRRLRDSFNPSGALRRQLPFQGSLLGGRSFASPERGGGPRERWRGYLPPRMSGGGVFQSPRATTELQFLTCEPAPRAPPPHRCPPVRR